MTIRRDIHELDKKTLLLKEQGGARSFDSILETDTKLNKFKKEKSILGHYINELISPGDVVFLGAGTTIYYATKNINFSEVTVITNSLLTFSSLSKSKSIDIYLTGGEFFSKTAEFYGSHAERLLEDFIIKTAFLSTNGILDNSLTTSLPLLGPIQEKILKLAETKFLVADSSKFNVADKYVFGKTSNLDGIITDANISQENIHKYSQLTKLFY